ncbi:hypothetical protein ABGB17_07135 [Sphaerisporangium sp. B11E5]|uniref:hypothetical protein n=1 Tax=Sphaerisporangium sp. B11E5 TaxID=3153563 RepID=UPI00325DEBB7
MAWLFAGLKLRLVAGNLRGGGLTRIAGFVVTVLAALVVGGGGLAVLSLLRLAPADVAAGAGVLVFTLVAVVWVVGPLMAFGVDDTLDPSRLALFPLTARQMAVGMFAASATGPWPFATLLLLTGAVIGVARGPGGVLIGVVAAVLQFALCVVASRAVTTALSRLLRTRRGRDLLAVGVLLLILAPQIPNLLLQRGAGDAPREMLARLAGTLRWTPPGMAAHAMADGGLVAFAELAVVALVVVVLGAVWIATLRRVMVTADASTQVGSVRRSRFDALLPGGVIGAVAAKELKYLRREPRGRLGWMTAVAVPVITMFSLANSGAPLPGLLAALIPAGAAALMIGLQGANAFGLDGRALWMNAVVHASERDLRTDLAGRHLAVSVAAAPLLLIISVAGALAGGDASSAVPALLGSAGLLGTALGVSAVISVVLPYTFPERINSFTSAAPGQGGVALAGAVAALLATSVLAVPVTLPAFLGATWVTLLAVPYGLLVAAGGRRLAAMIGYPRLPELMAAVSRPT